MSEEATRRRGRLRRLSEEEIELWLLVAAGVARRPGSSLPALVPSSVAAPAALPVAPPPAADPPAALLRPASTNLPPLAPLERKLKQRLSRGRMTADAVIDLHGFTRDQALSALRRFLMGAQRDGLRIVLVVTGKGGRPSLAFEGHDGIGVLKRSVPMWLDMPEFRPLVVGYEEAGRSHGGAGALYVRLRRRG